MCVVPILISAKYECVIKTIRQGGSRKESRLPPEMSKHIKIDREYYRGF